MADFETADPPPPNFGGQVARMSRIGRTGGTWIVLAPPLSANWLSFIPKETRPVAAMADLSS